MTTRVRLFTLGFLLTIPGIVRAETHRLIPERFYNTFSAAHPPALRIKPGDRVVTKTVDAGGTDWERQGGHHRSQSPNRSVLHRRRGARGHPDRHNREARPQSFDCVLVKPPGAVHGRPSFFGDARRSRTEKGDLEHQQGDWNGPGRRT